MSPLHLRKTDGSFTRAGCLWVITAILGVLLGGLSVLALLDPAGTKAADDADPFGTPPSRMSSLVWLGIALVMVAWPLALKRLHAKGTGASEPHPRGGPPA